MTQNTTISPGAGTDSDHRLVILSIRLKLQREANKRPQKSFDAWFCKVEDCRKEYMEGIRVKFDIRKQQRNAEERDRRS